MAPKCLTDSYIDYYNRAIHVPNPHASAGT